MALSYIPPWKAGELYLSGMEIPKYVNHDYQSSRQVIYRLFEEYTSFECR